jgi:hypothetical protein
MTVWRRSDFKRGQWMLPKQKYIDIIMQILQKRGSATDARV